MAIYIKATDAAKLLRKDLKAAFPTTKFSVRTEYTGTIWIQFDGTSEMLDAVNAIARNYRGADFDGMTDSTNYVTHQVNGEDVKYGCNYIFAQRNRSSQVAA